VLPRAPARPLPVLAQPGAPAEASDESEDRAR
jgi:hypothetical protein